eukprot:TRINITY_DN892_c0_g1_i11.p1 TRINITY_DN892_c0_g1~~TRINITY_DN892_c0_g1_i11.p1  ORF type:complete len:196 (-),score=35.19 TRINITY_DN892_c0_g1_i11:980-1567(-)
MFGPHNVGFIKFKCQALDRDGDALPASIFMRGGAVAILVILKCNGKDYALLVRQTSLATGEPLFPAIPAGMLDGEGYFAGVAAKEIKEETGLVIDASELTDLIELTYGDRYEGMYVSVGGTDEFIRLYSYTKTITEEELNGLEGKLTGAKEENEKIVLTLVPLEDLWRTTSDSKALSAIALYEGLKKSGKLSEKE